MSFTLTAPRFDYYAATVTDKDFGEHSTAQIRDERPRLVQGRNGYGHGYEIRREGRKVCTVFDGGMHEHPHVVASGQDAEMVARWLRSGRRSGRGYQHVVARADVCTDTTDEDAFVRLSVLAESLDDRLTRTLFEQTKAGVTAATLYLGAATSEARSRIYEKAKESPGEYAEGTVRAELQVRPKKAFRREWAATASPADIFGYTTWSRRLANVIGLGKAQAPPARSARVTDLEGSLVAMCGQYGNRLLELLEAHQGDVAAFGLELALRAENAGSLP